MLSWRRKRTLSGRRKLKKAKIWTIKAEKKQRKAEERRKDAELKKQEQDKKQKQRESKAKAERKWCLETT